ncbi:MAG: phosphodiesterase, partial [Promicromonosporaceae bacterium]|nr:phosphodiesterase [Promicromonosporaceae bacterium]
TLVAGEARASHVYLNDDDDANAAADRWRAFLRDRAVVHTRAQAISAGLFGPVAEHVRGWIGDLVVAATGHNTIVDSRTQSSNSRKLLGVHGSLTATEMQIPLLVTLT